MSIIVEELVTHLVVMCNVETSVDTAKSVTYIEGLIASVTVFKRLGGVTS